MPERGVAEEMAQALATVREGFRSSAPERLAQLRRQADAWKAHTPGAAALFAQTAHSLRGTASTLGFTEVARLAMELEKLATGQSPTFPSQIHEIFQALAEAFSQPPTAPSTTRESPEAAPAPSPRTSTPRFRVLALDDDLMTLAATRAVLEPAGLEVVTLTDARNLFASLQRHHPDLLLLDVTMPALNGFELLTQLRNDPAWRSLTVVFHTARDTASDRVRAFQLGADDYLIKPVEASELRTRLLAHLQRRSLLKAAAEKEVLRTQQALNVPAPGGSAPAASAPAASDPPRPPASTSRPSSAGSIATPLPIRTPSSSEQGATGATASRPPEPGSKPQARSQRILVADDEPALRRVLQRLLEQEGYVVETAEDGEEALSRLLNPTLTPVDLVLLDVHMPRRSGIDVLRALREASSTLPVLVLSARVRDAEVLKLYGEGAADFVAKPFSIQTLLSRVTRLLPPRSS